MSNQSITETHQQGTGAHVPQAAFTTAPVQALFWKPRFMEPSHVLIHVPMLFWLTAALGPSRAAVLGAGDGIVHFALCQAMEKLASGGSCDGYGYWIEPKKGKMVCAVPASLRAHEDMLYEGASRLRAGTAPGDALEELAAAPPDVLCVDLEALPVDAVLDPEAILRALGDAGVLLLFGTHSFAERNQGGKRLEELIRENPSVVFGGETAVALIVKGQAVPEPLRSLLKNADDGKLDPGTEAVFRRSGQGLVAAVRADALAHSRTKAQKLQAQAEAELQGARDALSKLQEVEEVRSRKIVDLQAEMFELRQQLCREGEEQKSRIAKLGAELQRARAERETHLDEMAGLTRISEEWRARASAHKDETLALEVKAAELRRQLGAALDKVRAQRNARHKMSAELKARVRKLRGALRRARNEAETWQQRAGHLESQVVKMLTSTSWKVTRPIRAVKHIFFGRGRSAD
ncbi:hypothetical protein [Luteimonas suaedae]|uniref:hypothetical protein n=1 Tax=Luteimonas suaedae TaxID=2605430 RepID=UPI0011EEA443|nr:hypothetical protein [Luteimonas suaedae]